MDKKSKIDISSGGKISAWIIAAIIFLFLHQIHDVQYFPWDAKGYWELSSPDVFFNYPKEIRGYFYPLLLLPANFLSTLFEDGQNYSYRLLSSFVYAYALTIILPEFYVRIFGGKLSVLRRIIAPLLLAILFPGLIIYPLSDLPAFLLLIGSISALLNAKYTSSRMTAGAFAVLGGILAAGAYNTRTIYLFPLFCVVGAVPFYFFVGQSLRNRFLGLFAFSAGLLLASLPQMFINHSTHGVWSPAVISQKTDKSLFALQLMWGITIQRYETTIDSTSPSASRYFMDRAGEKLFVSEDLENSDVTIKKYFSLVARHPLDFVGIYGRHLFNGLDLRDGEVYVKNSKWVNNKIAALNFLVLFLGVLSVLVRYDVCKLRRQASGAGVSMSRSNADVIWPMCLFILLFPIIAIIPGAIETRFFLPLHLLLYCTIAFNSSFSEMHFYLRKHWVFLSFGFGFLCMAFFAISTNTMSSMQPFIYPPYRFGQ